MILVLSRRVSEVEMVLAVEVTERELLEGPLVVMQGGLFSFCSSPTCQVGSTESCINPCARKATVPFGLEWRFDRSATAGVGPEFISSPRQGL